ncbi:MAG: hypothetical protein ACR2JM_02815 [Mycobacterium sp.]
MTDADPGVEVLAHGLGGSTDLPIPFTYTVIGASWALSFSFAILVFAWRTPRLRDDTPGKPLPGWVQAAVNSTVLRRVLGGFGLAFTLWVLAAGAFGPAKSSQNALPGTFYVLLWVGLVALSLLFGPVWKLISPVRALRPPATGRAPYREGWGYWPAVAGLFAFVWMELASPDPGSVRAILWWCGIYLVITVAGAFTFGLRWCERADPFEVYSTLVSRLSPVGRGDKPGTWVLRNPLNNLQATEIRAGSVALTATLLGSTAFDSFSARPGFQRFLDSTADSAFAATALRTASLLAMITFVGATFWIATRAVPGLSAEQRRALPGLLSPSLVPIIVGYVFAHYISYLAEKGQSAVLLLLDPFGRGWVHGDVNYFLSTHPSLLAVLKVLFVLAGHVLGVIAAHDRSLRVLPAKHQLTGQLPLFAVMVLYTCGGLYLLFGG